MRASIMIGLVLAAEAAKTDAPLLILDNPSPESTIELIVGQRLELRYEAQYATGFRWVAAVEGSAIRYDGTREVPPPQAGSLVSAAQVQSLSFTALSQGSAQIVLHYRRPWASGIPAQKSLTYMVVIGPPKL